MRGLPEHLVGGPHAGVLGQKGDEHPSVVVDHAFASPGVRVVREQITPRHDQATLPHPAVSAAISASMVANDAAA
ncbi:MAG: hypothetical protein ACRDNZ_00290 [Streptosporangiaceae bacterium]